MAAVPRALRVAAINRRVNAGLYMRAADDQGLESVVMVITERTSYPV